VYLTGSVESAGAWTYWIMMQLHYSTTFVHIMQANGRFWTLTIHARIEPQAPTFVFAYWGERRTRWGDVWGGALAS